MESYIKQVSIYYNQQHAKNLAHIVETATQMNLPLRSIGYIFPQRWVTNADLVINRMITNIPVLIFDLEAISTDTTFYANTRNDGKGLRTIVSSLEFITTLHFIGDIIANLNFFSRKLQEAGGLLIGKGHYHLDIDNAISG